jgi:hypothetical protein
MARQLELPEIITAPASSAFAGQPRSRETSAISVDVAGDPFEAKRRKKPAQVRCDPGVDFGVCFFPLGHGRFHLLKGDFERRATPAERQLGLAQMVRATGIADMKFSEVAPAGRPWGISIAANCKNARSIRHLAAQSSRAASSDRTDPGFGPGGRRANVDDIGHFRSWRHPCGVRGTLHNARFESGVARARVRRCARKIARLSVCVVYADKTMAGFWPGHCF